MDTQRRPGEHARSAQRRADIVRAASHCFAEQGVDATSLRQVAARAGMTHAGLLHHYASKEELVTAVLQQRDQEEDRRASTWPPGPADLHGHLLPFLTGVLREHRSTPEVMRLAAELAVAASRAQHPGHRVLTERYEQVRRRTAEYFSSLQAAGELRDDVDTGLVAVLLPAVLDGLQTQWLLDPQLDIEAPLTHFLDLLSREHRG